MTILGAEFATWANFRVGDTCTLCGGEIECTPLGMADGQSRHQIACDCTVIESGPASDVNDD
jgi:hypothetical protein